jgi:tRNA uridine 5-carboxymethylaminomethyl modification enzyme
VFERWQAFCEKMEAIEIESQRLKNTWIHKEHEQIDAVNAILKTSLSREASLEDLIRRPEVSYDSLAQISDLGSEIENRIALEQVEIQIKYAGYIARQQEEINKQLRHQTHMFLRMTFTQTLFFLIIS